MFAFPLRCANIGGKSAAFGSNAIRPCDVRTKGRVSRQSWNWALRYSLDVRFMFKYQTMTTMCSSECGMAQQTFTWNFWKMQQTVGSVVVVSASGEFEANSSYDSHSICFVTSVCWICVGCRRIDRFVCEVEPCLLQNKSHRRSLINIGHYTPSNLIKYLITYN